MDTNTILLNKANEYGFRSWFSENESTSYSLKDEKLFSAFEDAIIEAKMIDCIWFDGNKRMPALFKVCRQSVWESLCRLNNLKQLLPPYYSKFFLIVGDIDYQIAMMELSKPTFANCGICIITQSELLNASLN